MSAADTSFPAALLVSAGALLGKVGESGDVFLIGEKYTGTPKGQGKLFLPSRWKVNDPDASQNFCHLAGVVVGT